MIRTITWTVNPDMTISPTEPQEGGVQGDSNATKAVFNIPQEIENFSLYIEYIDATGVYDKTDTLEIENGTVSVMIPLAWTQVGSDGIIRLVAEADEMTAYSFDGRVRYDSRDTAVRAVNNLLDGKINALMQRAEQAINTATESSESASASAISAQLSASESATASISAGQHAASANISSQNASSYAISASNRSTEAAASATEAAASATEAAASATEAETSSTNAAASATAAAGSASAAQSSATAAAGSASSAQGSAANAAASATSAAASATNAAASATAATTAATNAAASATAAEAALETIQSLPATSAAIIVKSDTAKNQVFTDSADSDFAALSFFGECTQSATPTVSAPVEVVSVENPVIHVYGKNMINDGALTKLAGDGSITYPGNHIVQVSSTVLEQYTGAYVTIPVVGLLGKTVTVSADVMTSGYSYSRLRVGYVNSNGEWGGSYGESGIANISGRFVEKSLTVTLPSTKPADMQGEYFVLALFANSTGSVASTSYNWCQYRRIQVELGSSKTDFEPYQAAQAVTIPYPLRGLKYQGVWDSIDTVVVGDGSAAVIREVNRLELTGNETITRYNNVMFRITPTQMPVAGYYGSLCNYYSSNNVSVSGMTDGHCRVSGAIYIRDDRYTTVDAFKAYLAGLYALGTPVTVYYRCAEQTTDITDTPTGQQLMALRSHYSCTLVMSDADVQISYKADTKNYIDQQIAACAALALEN